ncbi:MAG: Adaptive-response sensory-kinase SasA [Planctomycetes bacterium]|nr:Adaptive-response sensory-kinase SasA [Planctomycetota bacterium]
MVPAPAAAPWTAIAFLADRTSLLDAAVRPAAARAESPPGTVMTVRDESGAVVAGDAALGDIAGRPLATMELGRSFPGLRATVVVADPEALAAGTRSSRRYWLFVLAGAALAVAAASVLAVRAVLREVRLARMKSDFVSNLSHELRTPLTSMRMFVETLQEGRVRDEAERKECIDVIAHETDRLSSLVDRVLTFASFAKGRAPIDLAPGDLADAARRAAALFRKRAESAGATLEVRVQGGVPEVRLDRDAVVQVILNLLDNAVKHAGHDGAKIRVTVAASEGGAAVSVDDDGPGVPERERELVFEEFYRGDDTLSRRTQGAGIGLALCRRIVLAHGGTVRAERSAGLGGASFRVWLPASARSAPGRDATARDTTSRDTTSRDAPARGGDRAEATS